MKQKNPGVSWMLGVYALESIAANLAHPVTPTLIDELGLPSYMFGVLFAGMSLTSCLFSPWWGRVGARIGSKRVLGICCVGYAAGQAMFGMARDQLPILLARMTSGFFVGGIGVCTLTYLIACSDEQTRGKNLTLCATVVTVFGAFGYLVGGVIGDRSIPGVFGVQVVLLALCGVLFWGCLQGEERVPAPPKAAPQPSPSPDGGGLAAGAALVLGGVFLTSFASTAYDQCFNYYGKAQLGFPPSYNGMLKALVGMVSLAANLTVCVWMVRSRRVSRCLTATLGAGAVFLALMTLTRGSAGFIGVNIPFFICNAVYIPLLQNLCADVGGREHRGEAMGAYNSLKSLGMIAGALAAGFLYQFGAKLPFLCAALLFLAGAALIWAYGARLERTKDETT